MWWCQFIDKLKFETRPNSLMNFGTANSIPQEEPECEPILRLAFLSLADAFGCRIEVYSNTALGKPQYNNLPPRQIYSCTPGSSSPQYEVHVLSVYQVINTRPPSAGDAAVNIVRVGQSGRPIVLVFASYQPVNWILNLPAGITISKVLLVSIRRELKLTNHFLSDKLGLY